MDASDAVNLEKEESKLSVNMNSTELIIIDIREKNATSS
jgi:hypothetical protein